MISTNKINTNTQGNIPEQELMFDQLMAGIKNLPGIEPQPNFTAQVMSRIKAKEKPRWFALPVLTYSFVFIIFGILGLLLNPLLTLPNPKPKVINASSDYSALLVESQELNLIEIQAKTIEMVYNGEQK
ncbi:MAG: hypothetical protein MUF15_21100 [Acidobacteria bacterium]|jgi:hypothetical protein|nr:hypothetical protein [Acidobacteriota bacterium]